MTTQFAGGNRDTFTPEKLVAGDMQLVPRVITLLSGQNCVRGAVLGRKATAGTISGAAQSGNTGTGTIGSLSVGGRAKEGRYRIVCIEPASDLGKFMVIDPEGINIGVATVGSAFAGAINFTIADGGTDFVSGDAFNVDVSAVTYKHELSVATATDGSEVPDVILMVDTDASSADVTTQAYETGTFFDTAVTLGSGHTIASIREGLRLKGIHFVKSMGA